ARLLRSGCEGWIRADVRRRNSLGAARNRIGNREGPGHGQDDAAAVQGLDDNQQLHDRCDRCRECGSLPAPWLHRAGACFSSDAGSPGWRTAGGANSRWSTNAMATATFHRGRRHPRVRNAVQRPARRIVTNPQQSEAASRDARDLRVEQIIGRLLQLGVLAAALVVLVGGVLLLRQYGHLPASFGTFAGEDATLRSLTAII